ncbi:hypothetical protein SDC9_198715 [bioreactor metagenome]|uniref:Lipoprotein n=1 Tax=bioreactor metagenome TaxID=1076179 RepID=A0A645IRP7_9ZZZZ|nr:hypothetical protein [Christensenella sp.]
MKKSLILLAMVVFSVFFFTACGPKGVASGGNALATYGNGMVSGGNVAPIATAGNAG